MSRELGGLLQAMFDSSTLGVTVADREGRWLRGNPAFVRLLDYTREELVGTSFLSLTHPDDRDENARLYAALWAEELTDFTLEKRFVRRDGTAVWVRVTASLSTDRQFAVAMVEDITQLRLEREQRARLEYELIERKKELTCLSSAARLMADRGRSTEEVLEGLCALLPPAFQFPPSTSASVRLGARVRTTAGFHDTPHELSAQFVTAHGEQGQIVVRYDSPPLAVGQPAFLVEEQSLLDSLAELARVEFERRHADEALAESTARLELALQAAQMGLWEWDVVNDRSYGSESVAAFVGLRGPIDGPTGVLAAFIHPDDRAVLYGHMQALAKEPWKEPDELEYRLARPEGGWRTVHAKAWVTRDARGCASRVLAVLTDVTVERALGEHLARTRQLDALGLVTSSVAHDFNNVLAVALAGVGLLQLELPEGPARDRANAVATLARRGAALATQLLAFSRRAEFRRAELDVAQAVERSRPVLERLLGDDVKLVTSLSADCIAVCNAEQLEQVLLSLALNAHEAMAGVGTVTVAVRPVECGPEHVKLSPEVRPGPMVELSVSDSGPGIAPEVLGRVFEPWFTTRNARGASGLGLALAQSIARAHEGHLWVESPPGQGATFRLWLPREP